MRAIDADAFKDYIKNALEETKHIYKDNGAWAKEITESFCKDIDEQPTIQPKRGKWHYSDGKPATIGLSFGVVCDQCGTESEYCTNFCGECGADMRE